MHHTRLMARDMSAVGKAKSKKSAADRFTYE